MANDDALVIDVPEAAKLLGIGRNLCYQLVREGRLPAIRLGRRVLVPRQRLQDWIAREAGLGEDGARDADTPDLLSSGPPER